MYVQIQKQKQTLEKYFAFHLVVEVVSRCMQITVWHKCVELFLFWRDLLSQSHAVTNPHKHKEVHLPSPEKTLKVPKVAPLLIPTNYLWKCLKEVEFFSLVLAYIFYKKILAETTSFWTKQHKKIKTKRGNLRQRSLALLYNPRLALCWNKA